MKKLISIVILLVFISSSISVAEAKSTRKTHVKSHIRKGKIVKSHPRHTPTHYKKCRKR